MTHTLTAEGHDAGEDGTGRGTPIIAQAVALQGRQGGAELELGGDIANALRTPAGGASHAMVFVKARRAGENDSSPESWRLGDVAPTLDANGQGPRTATAVVSLAVAGDFSSSEDIAQTVRAAHGQPGVVAIDLRNAARKSGNGVGTQGDGIREGGPSYSLSATERALPGVAAEAIVRRLTPMECERLQGFPDDHTAGQKDSPRYKQMGNAVAVPVVEWIMRRIVDVDSRST